MKYQKITDIVIVIIERV